MRWLFWSAVIATLLVALVLGAFLVGGLPELLPPGSAIVIEGKRHEIGDITVVLAEHWPLVAIGVLIVALVIVIVVPIVAALALGVPLLAGALGTAAALLAIALVLSPIVLLGRWLWKASKKNATTIGA